MGWDPIARPEADGLRWGRMIFHQKNTCDLSPNVTTFGSETWSGKFSSDGEKIIRDKVTLK